MKAMNVLSVLASLAFVLPAVVWADTVDLMPVRDNTLYEDAGGSLSNGEGARFFAGTTAPAGGNAIRRGLIAFDLADHVPPGATITAVTLRLQMSRTISGSQDVTLHRVLSDWGEGASRASGEEGAGGQAASGDATWLHRFYDNEFWDQPGGDFRAEPSAGTPVGGTGTYTWSSPEMVADVQEWLQDPETNFGWLVRGNEGASGTAKRFESRHSSNPDWRPRLTVEYEMAEPPAAPPRFTGVRWVGSGLELTFTTMPDRTHFLEWTAALEANPSWETHTAEIEGDGEPVTIIDETAAQADRRFYRVRVAP